MIVESSDAGESGNMVANLFALGSGVSTLLIREPSDAKAFSVLCSCGLLVVGNCLLSRTVSRLNYQARVYPLK